MDGDLDARTAARRRAEPPVIDGQAVVVGRRPMPARRTAPAPAPGPDDPGARPAGSGFARRLEERRPAARDLVFQGAAARPFGGASEAIGGLSLFRRAAGPGRSGGRRLLGAAAALALLALPVGMLSGPVGPAVATQGMPAAEALVLADLVTSIRPRGAGAVLSVEGLVRNVSGGAAPVPTLRIALAEPDGGVRSKALSTGVGRLEPGRAFRFHSTLAVAKGTRGDVEVGFIDASRPARKTSVE